MLQSLEMMTRKITVQRTSKPPNLTWKTWPSTPSLWGPRANRGDEDTLQTLVKHGAVDSRWGWVLTQQQNKRSSHAYSSQTQTHFYFRSSGISGCRAPIP